MKNIKLHKAAGIIALITLSTFFISTIIIELLGDPESIKLLKLLIMIFALGVMVPSSILIGVTGKKIAKGYNSNLLKKKLNLFKYIQRIGPFILAPTGIALFLLSRADNFNLLFYAVQITELIAQFCSILLIITGIKTGASIKNQRRELG